MEKNTEKSIEKNELKRIPNPTGKGGFQKGHKPVSPGRPQIPPVFKELAKSYALPALYTVIEISKNEKNKTSDRLRACELIIERVYGKATQPISPEGELKELIIKWLEK